MKVHELINQLAAADPEAEVLLGLVSVETFFPLMVASPVCAVHMPSQSVNWSGIDGPILVLEGSHTLESARERHAGYFPLSATKELDA